MVEFVVNWFSKSFYKGSGKAQVLFNLVKTE